MPKPYAELLADLGDPPGDAGTMDNIIDDIRAQLPEENPAHRILEGLQRDMRDEERRASAEVRRNAHTYLFNFLTELVAAEGAPLARARRMLGLGGKRRTQSAKFGSCVKAVRKTVKARKGSNPESAAIAICTKSMLFPRGRTLKRYKKGRLVTQKRRA